MEFVRQFLTPLIKVIFIGGFLGAIGWYVGKAVYNGWSKHYKFVWKYKIKKQQYPEKTLIWCLDASDKGLGWYDIKKILMVAGKPTSQINEILWIYDEIFKLNQKGGKKTNGREHQRSYSEIEKQSTEQLPTI